MTTHRLPQGWLAGGIGCALGLLMAASAGAGLIPGGGPTKSDCYVEVSVDGVDNPSSRVQKNNEIIVTDGEAGDVGPCGDFACTIRVGVCINQTDPNVPDCTPPASLDKVQVKGAFKITVPALLTGSACGAFVTQTINAKVKRDKNGNIKSAKAGKAKVMLVAQGPAGTKPRTDKDTVTFVCLPRTVACSSVAGDE